MSDGVFKASRNGQHLTVAAAPTEEHDTERKFWNLRCIVGRLICPSRYGDSA